MSELSLGVRRRGQHRFHFFTVFNVVSFNFLSGNVIALYAMRLGADSVFVGLLAAFVHVAELMPPFGKAMVGRFGAVRVMGVSWVTRYLAMVPLFVAPFVMRSGASAAVGLGLCVVSALGFNVARGVGITSNNPIVGAITSQQDRGGFLSRNQLIIQVVGIATGIVTALILQSGSGGAALERYSIVMGIGIAAGLTASGILFGLPEPPDARRAARTPLGESVARSMRRGGLRRFVVAHSVSTVILNMAGPFLVVFLKRGFLLGDDTVVAFTVVGSLGAIATALLGSVMLDRFGAKPFASIFAALTALALALPLAAPPSARGSVFWVFAGGMFFLYTMGAAGLSTSLNTYFFSLVDASERLNMGIVYFLVTGIAGGAGSLLGGVVLRALQAARGLGDVAGGLPAFRVYFGALAGGLVLLLPLILALEKLGSRDVREVLTTLLSLRDLRAIMLLGRLARSREAGDEGRVLRALGEASSELSREEILRRVASPMLSIRMEALAALARMPLDADIERALESEVRNHRFTTAHVAAEIAGRRGARGAVAALRGALRSGDYMLEAAAMVALAKLGDLRSLPEVRRIVAGTDNPRLLISGAQALEIAGEAADVPLLLGRLSRRQEPFVRDEIILCTAGMLGFKGDFYGWYIQFLERTLLGLSAIRDFMQERILARANPAASPEVLSLVIEEAAVGGEGFVEAVRQALTSVRVGSGGFDVTAALLAALRDDALLDLERFRFLLAAAVVWFAFSAKQTEGVDGGGQA